MSSLHLLLQESVSSLYADDSKIFYSSKLFFKARWGTLLCSKPHEPQSSLGLVYFSLDWLWLLCVCVFLQKENPTSVLQSLCPHQPVLHWHVLIEVLFAVEALFRCWLRSSFLVGLPGFLIILHVVETGTWRSLGFTCSLEPSHLHYIFMSVLVTHVSFSAWFSDRIIFTYILQIVTSVKGFLSLIYIILHSHSGRSTLKFISDLMALVRLGLGLVIGCITCATCAPCALVQLNDQSVC